LFNRSEQLELVLLASLLLAASSLLHTSAAAIPLSRTLSSLANLMAGLCVYYSGNSSGKSNVNQRIKKKIVLCSVFGTPGSGSGSFTTRYGSGCGSGSFRHQAKIV
jgi:hypothetical protein